MTSIPFTQYLMPDGRTTIIHIVDPKEIDPTTWSNCCASAQKIIDAGYRFEIEMLSDYSTISMTVTGYDPQIDEDNDIAHRLCANGPDVSFEVVALVDSAFRTLQEWSIIT